MDIITGRAPPSHEPMHSAPGRVESSHGLDVGIDVMLIRLIRLIYFICICISARPPVESPSRARARREPATPMALAISRAPGGQRRGSCMDGRVI